MADAHTTTAARSCALRQPPGGPDTRDGRTGRGTRRRSDTRCTADRAGRTAAGDRPPRRDLLSSCARPLQDALLEGYVVRRGALASSYGGSRGKHRTTPELFPTSGSAVRRAQTSVA